MNEKVIGQAISQYKTPFYIFDTEILACQIKKIRAALGSNVELCYAMKANPFIIKELEGMVEYFEVCSPGEFRICEKACIDMNKIVMSGVYKAPEDLEYALRTYGSQMVYTIESFAQWQMIDHYTAKHQLPVRVLLRLTNGNQFGMDETVIRQIIAGRQQNAYVTIEGIQFFSGTQKKSGNKYENELTMLEHFCADLKNQLGFTVEKLEYGPGLPVYYFEDEKNDEEGMLHALAAQIQKLHQFVEKVTLEMGRYIAATCGSYVTGVVDMKINKKQPYCLIDGGIHHVNYYGQMLGMKKPPIIHWKEKGSEPGEAKEWTICGSLCTTNDILVKQYPFTDLQLGDKLIFEKTGAYAVTEGISLFLSRELPQVIVYSEKDNFRLARTSIRTDSLNYFLE